MSKDNWRLHDLSGTELDGKVVLLRVDAASPVVEGEVAWVHKLITALPTLEVLSSGNASVVVLTHGPCGIEFQRAAGRRLASLLGKPVDVLDSCRGAPVMESVARMKGGEVLMLGNLTLEPAEEANEPEFARFLAGLGDIYCDEAFALAHEVRASTVGAAMYARRRVAGFEFSRTAGSLELALEHPMHPFVAIFGGSLSTGKLLLIESIAARADVVFVGGELCFAFLEAEGRPAGPARVADDEQLEIAARVSRMMRYSDRQLYLPEDFVLLDAREAKRLGPEERRLLDQGKRLTSVSWRLGSSTGPHEIAGDIGIHTRRSWGERLSPARTILWHGPLGMCEFSPLEKGTESIAAQVAAHTWPSIPRTLVCGESLVRTLQFPGSPLDQTPYLNTAGTAILHYAARRPLPALEVLRQSGRKRPSVLLALAGTEQDVPLASFVGNWFPEAVTIHSVYVEAGPDEDQYPDLYLAMTKAERVAETSRAMRIFARANGSLASQGATSSTQALLHGDPSEKVIQRARELSADVVVMGSGAAAGRGRYSRDRIVAGTPCHVIVFP